MIMYYFLYKLDGTPRYRIKEKAYDMSVLQDSMREFKMFYRGFRTKLVNQEMFDLMKINGQIDKSEYGL